MTVNDFKTKVEWLKNTPFLQKPAAAEAVLHCAVIVMEQQDKRIQALEQQLAGVCRG